MSVVAPTSTQRPAVLEGIDWRTYSRILRALAGQRGFRLTYDRGTLEIMSPLWEHENPAYLLGCFIDVLTEELRMPCRGGRSVTLRRKRKQRGLEPNNCYWLASAPQMQGKTTLNLRTDPPPDLAIEVDITHSSIDRMVIYAALQVPEVWRLSATGLTFNVLQGSAYQMQANSLAFLNLASADLVPFLARAGQSDDTTLLIQFRDWVRQHFLPRLAP